MNDIKITLKCLNKECTHTWALTKEEQSASGGLTCPRCGTLRPMSTSVQGIPGSNANKHG